MKSMNNKNLKVIDLFSGAGGLSLGATRAGFHVVGSVENDPHAIATHKRNFPNVTHFESDISTLMGIDILNKLNLKKGDLTGVIGGPPCQGFSVIGRRNKHDVRNALFVEFFRIVKETEPVFFVAENVPGILNDKNNELREKAFSLVQREYLLLEPMKLSANEYGAPTTRTRVFFIGFKKNASIRIDKESFNPPKEIEYITVEKALAGLTTEIDPDWQNEIDEWQIVKNSKQGYFEDRLRGVIPEGVGDPNALMKLEKENKVSGFLGTKHSKKIIRRYASIECGKSDKISKSRRLEPKGFCPTLRAGTGKERGSFQAVRPLHPNKDRVITPREAARLQGFPDWFKFPSTKWHSFRQIGNSVSPILAERIFSVLFKSVIKLS